MLPNATFKQKAKARSFQSTWHVIYVSLLSSKCRYGNKLIALAKGKNAVEFSNGDELIIVLMKLKDAINDGTLNSEIELAADSVKARFTK